jgi:hypothetical protein
MIQIAQDLIKTTVKRQERIILISVKTSRKREITFCSQRKLAIEKPSATSTDTQISKPLLKEIIQLNKPRDTGDNSVIKKRETSTAWLIWTTKWQHAISTAMMISRLLRTKLQMRPPKSTGLDGDTSREETHTALKSSLTTKLSAIWRNTLISNKHSD